jgi:hypothetical protein
MPRKRRSRPALTKQQRIEIQLRLNEVIAQKKAAWDAEDFDRAVELMDEQTRLWESLLLLPNWHSANWVVLSKDDAQN